MAASKTIALSESAYSKLKARKREGESFSDVVDRMAGERSLLEIAGTVSQEESEEFRAAINEARESMDRSAEETYREMIDGTEADTEESD